jgi:type III secretory pathway component EscV
MEGTADIITTTVSSVPGSTGWMFLILATAISVLWVHSVRTRKEEREDRKAERDALISILKDNAAIIRENTTAFVEMRETVRSLQKMMSNYIHHER